MNSYATIATVQDQGQISVSGVPFASGTEVEITISPRTPVDVSATDPDDQALATTRERMRELFAAVKGFRMAPKIRREELYEGRCVH